MTKHNGISMISEIRQAAPEMDSPRPDEGVLAIFPIWAAEA
jgi:hypothetical protein